MIDPHNIINYDRDVNELQEFLLFAVVVAGKNAAIQAKKLEEFLRLGHNSYTANNGRVALTHWGMLQWMSVNNIEKWLRHVGMGQYERIKRVFKSVASLIDVRTCDLEKLTSIKGIGPKTAKFFLLYTRKSCKYAVLDTHILKFLRKIRVENVPLTTPQKKKDYERLEKEFIEAWEIAGNGLTLAEFDLTIWRYYNESLQII